MLRYLFLTAILAVTNLVRAIPGPYSQRFSDEVMDVRLCVSMMTGLDYISYSISNIMWLSADFYNNPLSYPHQRKGSQRYKEVETKTQLHDIQFIRPDETWKGNVTIEGDASNFDLVLDYPLKFNNKGIYGYLDFGLRIKVRQNYDAKEEKNKWNISI